MIKQKDLNKMTITQLEKMYDKMGLERWKVYKTLIKKDIKENKDSFEAKKCK